MAGRGPETFSEETPGAVPLPEDRLKLSLIKWCQKWLAENEVQKAATLSVMGAASSGFNKLRKAVSEVTSSVVVPPAAELDWFGKITAKVAMAGAVVKTAVKTVPAAAGAAVDEAARGGVQEDIKKGHLTYLSDTAMTISDSSKAHPSLEEVVIKMVEIGQWVARYCIVNPKKHVDFPREINHIINHIIDTTRDIIKTDYNDKKPYGLRYSDTERHFFIPPRGWVPMTKEQKETRRMEKEDRLSRAVEQAAKRAAVPVSPAKTPRKKKTPLREVDILTLEEEAARAQAAEAERQAKRTFVLECSSVSAVFRLSGFNPDELIAQLIYDKSDEALAGIMQALAHQAGSQEATYGYWESLKLKLTSGELRKAYESASETLEGAKKDRLSREEEARRKEAEAIEKEKDFQADITAVTAVVMTEELGALIYAETGPEDLKTKMQVLAQRAGSDSDYTYRRWDGLSTTLRSDKFQAAHTATLETARTANTARLETERVRREAEEAERLRREAEEARRKEEFQADKTDIQGVFNGKDYNPNALLNEMKLDGSEEERAGWDRAFACLAQKAIEKNKWREWSALDLKDPVLKEKHTASIESVQPLFKAIIGAMIAFLTQQIEALQSGFWFRFFSCFNGFDPTGRKTKIAALEQTKGTLEGVFRDKADKNLEKVTTQITEVKTRVAMQRHSWVSSKTTKSRKDFDVFTDIEEKYKEAWTALRGPSAGG